MDNLIFKAFIKDLNNFGICIYNMYLSFIVYQIILLGLIKLFAYVTSFKNDVLMV